ncbi:MAG: LOG family protein [Gammaproteobacteria bacterium]|nr:LOG family protein [Gammaproteobacteria bacterium]
MNQKKPDKAYENSAFLNSSGARSLRILSEYIEPASRFARYRIEDTIVFMGSARTPSGEQETGPAAGSGRSQYYQAARQLAFRLTEWSKQLDKEERRFVVCTGGGPGIMEAANRGASEANGVNVGLNISIPDEQSGNPFITRELSFEFHYFFMRKFWFIYLAKAIIFFPGGFGTFDELFEVLTLLQTGKIRKHLPLVLFGTAYWNEVVNFDALLKHGSISREDLDLFFCTDSVDQAFEFVTRQLTDFSLSEPGARL